MCRSIKVLRNDNGPVAEHETTEAALQYVRKVSGYRKPSKANQDAFDEAVGEIAVATQKLLNNLTTRKETIS